MLSYQHIYHAGNAADVHKHALLAAMLAYLTRKDKPLSYIETHAGRGLYDLGSAEAIKTGEAAQGVARHAARLHPDHPYVHVLSQVRAQHGPSAYPGSPLVAKTLLRDTDRLHLAELHPQEHAALAAALEGPGTKVYRADGFDLAQSLCPPEPRRGLMLVDPSYELKSDYDRVPAFLSTIHKKWNVGVLVAWYPVLTTGAERGMVDRLRRDLPQALILETRFPPAREGHRMVGSGLAVLNPPFGIEDEARDLASLLGGDVKA